MKKKNDLKTELIRVRLSSREKNRAKRLAKTYGYTYSEWVREAIILYNPRTKK